MRLASVAVTVLAALSCERAPDQKALQRAAAWKQRDETIQREHERLRAARKEGKLPKSGLQWTGSGWEGTSGSLDGWIVETDDRELICEELLLELPGRVIRCTDLEGGLDFDGGDRQ